MGQALWWGSGEIFRDDVKSYNFQHLIVEVSAMEGDQTGWEDSPFLILGLIHPYSLVFRGF